MLNKILGVLAFYLPPPFSKYIHKIRGVQIKDMSSLFIGAHVNIDHAYPEKVTIGRNVTIASGSRITAHITPPITIQRKYLPASAEDIVIGDNVFIGVGVIILKGVTIGDWTIIGAGSIVTKDVAEYKVVAGNPAKVIADIRDYGKDKDGLTSFPSR